MTNRQRTYINRASAVFFALLALILFVGLLVEILRHVSSYAGPGSDYLENSATLEPSTFSVKPSEDIDAQAVSVVEKGWQGGPHATLCFYRKSFNLWKDTCREHLGSQCQKN